MRTKISAYGHHVAMTRQDNRRIVGEWLEARRGELGLSLTALAAASGVAKRTLQNAEAGRSELTPANRSHVERVLKWEAGSLTSAYRRGEPPTPAETRLADVLPPDPELVALINHPSLDDDQRERLLARLRRMQRELVADAREWYGIDVSAD